MFLFSFPALHTELELSKLSQTSSELDCFVGAILLFTAARGIDNFRKSHLKFIMSLRRLIGMENGVWVGMTKDTMWSGNCQRNSRRAPRRVKKYIRMGGVTGPPLGRRRMSL